MSRDLQWDESESEFFINRHRDLKSKKFSEKKDISTTYVERNVQKNISRIDVIQSKRAKKKFKLLNEVIVYDDHIMIEKFLAVIVEFNVWDEHDISMIILFENHMSIDLKSNWTDKIKINKIYFLESNEKVIMNEIFDNLHAKNKMKWFTNSTSFDYFVFVIYRTITKDDKFVRKERAMINIRELNAIIVSNAYFMSTQTEIIVTVAECQYIFVMNVLEYFYQWTIKFDDRHKLTIISHKEQKQFNVCVMSFKNSSIYVQRQTNLMFKDLRVFAKTYLNDIMIFFKNLNDHLEHLRRMFQWLQNYNVILNSKKVFLEYFFIVLLKQIVDVLELTTTKEKLTIIINLAFSRSLKELKTYLKLTEYLRVYVFWYAQASFSLQNRKTLLLKESSTKEKSRKFFFKNKLLKQFTDVEMIFYEHLQQVFNDKKFLDHVNNIRKLFVDVNISKKKETKAMIFHVKENFEKKIAFNRFDI
jgi:hypothetical protein